MKKQCMRVNYLCVKPTQYKWFGGAAPQGAKGSTGAAPKVQRVHTTFEQLYKVLSLNSRNPSFYQPRLCFFSCFHSIPQKDRLDLLIVGEQCINKAHSKANRHRHPSQTGEQRPTTKRTYNTTQYQRTTGNNKANEQREPDQTGEQCIEFCIL